MRVAVLVAGVLLSAIAPRAASAQTVVRRVVLVADPSLRGTAGALAEALGELVEPYAATVRVQDPGAPPDVDAAVTLTLTRGPRGVSVVLAQTRIETRVARPRALALRVLTAIRGTLESAPDPSLEAPADDPPTLTAWSPPESEPLWVGAPRALRPPSAVAGPTARRAAHTLALEAGVGAWSPLGAAVFFGGSLRLTGRVGGSARSAAVLGAEVMVLAPRGLVLSGAPERVGQLPVLFDAAWTTRRGALTASVGGSFAALVTTVGTQSQSSTLAFGAGALIELGARFGQRVSLVARARALCIAHTTVLRGDEVAVGSIGPFFGAGELALRVAL